MATMAAMRARNATPIATPIPALTPVLSPLSFLEAADEAVGEVGLAEALLLPELSVVKGVGLNWRLVRCPVVVSSAEDTVEALDTSIEEVLDTAREALVEPTSPVALGTVPEGVVARWLDETGCEFEGVDPPVMADQSSGDTAENVSSVVVPLQPPLPQHIHRLLAVSYAMNSWVYSATQRVSMHAGMSIAYHSGNL